MSTKTTESKTKTHEIVLLQMGVGKQIVVLDEGATLADLFRVAQTDAAGQEVFVDGRPLEESLVLPPGAIVSVMPKVVTTDDRGGWADVIGSFRDSDEFDAMMREVEAERDAEKSSS